MINYRNHRGGLVNEVLTFDADGLVREGHGTYLEQATRVEIDVLQRGYSGGFIRSKQHSDDCGGCCAERIPATRTMKRELFDRVCSGQSVSAAEVAMGVSHGLGHQWWHKAGGMTLATGRRGGVTDAVDRDGPGGRGHRINLAERVEIMRGPTRG